jgi:hypothetical protein
MARMASGTSEEITEQCHRDSFQPDSVRFQMSVAMQSKVATRSPIVSV